MKFPSEMINDANDAQGIIFYATCFFFFFFQLNGSQSEKSADIIVIIIINNISHNKNNNKEPFLSIYLEGLLNNIYVSVWWLYSFRGTLFHSLTYFLIYLYKSFLFMRPKSLLKWSEPLTQWTQLVRGIYFPYDKWWCTQICLWLQAF